MMISATDGLDEWTVSQLGEFAIRLDRIASEEVLWNSAIQADTSTSRGASPTTRGGKTRVCHNCGKPGHIVRDCRSKPRAGNAATNMRPANAPANQRSGPRGPSYHCHQMGHVAAECPDCQPGGKLARREHGKPWCEHHHVNSHSTDECRALNNDKLKAEARATHTMDEEPASSHDAPDRPTYNELLEFWESQQAMMAQGYSGTLIARSMANASPCSVSRPSARATSTFHPGLTKRDLENQRIKGRLSNMPLGFLPHDTIGPPRPMPAPALAPHVSSAGSEPEPIADPPARVTRIHDPSLGSTRPQRSQPVEPVWAEPAMPLGFEELPAQDERYQGQIYGPSKPGPNTVPAEGPDDGHQDADEPAPETPGTADSKPEPLETTSPAKKSEPSSIEPEGSDRPAVPVVGTANDSYDAANPDLAALLSRLSGSYHSDRAQGTYRSPRIDNKGPRPAMVINGQVLHNLVLDCGADAVLVGLKTAARLHLKPDMIRKNAIRIRVASGSTVFMDETIKPVDFVLNPGTRDESTVWAKIVIVHGDLPNTLIGMSVMGCASIYPNSYKGTVKYYVNWWEPNARKTYLRCHMPVDLPTSGRPGARSSRLSVAFCAST
jgi:hypothetical protein